MKVMYERVAGIDVHKDMIKVAIRSPGEKPWPGRPRSWSSGRFTGCSGDGPRAAQAWCHARGDGGQRGLHRAGVLRAVRAGLHRGAVSTRCTPRRSSGHKTDAKDCARLAELFECGLLQRVLHPGAGAEGGAGPDPVRMKTVQARTSEIQRLAKRWNRPGSSSARLPADITGGSATAMIEALIDGERRGAVMADLARPDAGGGQAGRPVDGADRPVHRAPCVVVPPAPGPIAGFDAAVAGLDERIAGKVTRPGSPGRNCSRPSPASATWWPGLAGRDRPRPAPALRHLREAGLLDHAMPGEQHQRPQAQARPDRGCRDLHQADAGAGGLVRDPGPGAAAGPVQPAWSAASAATRTRPRRRRRSRDRAHPAQDRLPVLKTGRRTRIWARTSTPAAIARTQARPGWNASCKGFTPAAPSPSPSARRRPP